MKDKIYDYARVSSKDQNEARQLLALVEFGIQNDRIADLKGYSSEDEFVES